MASFVVSDETHNVVFHVPKSLKNSRLEHCMPYVLYGLECSRYGQRFTDKVPLHKSFLSPNHPKSRHLHPIPFKHHSSIVQTPFT